MIIIKYLKYLYTWYIVGLWVDPWGSSPFRKYVSKNAKFIRAPLLSPVAWYKQRETNEFWAEVARKAKLRNHTPDPRETFEPILDKSPEAVAKFKAAPIGQKYIPKLNELRK